MGESEPDIQIESPPPNPWRRAAGFIVGVALLGVAVWAVYANSGTFSAAADAVADAPRLLILAAIVLPFAHWHCTSIVFWLLSRRYGLVRFGEMHLLIGAAALLNLMPMRPGMFGRIAYHKRVNGIRVQDAIKVTVLCMVLTAIVNTLALLVALASYRASPFFAWAALAAPALLLAAAGFARAAAKAGVFEPAAAVLLASAVRYLDTLVWITRYAIGFSLIGHPISPVNAAIFAGAAQLAMLVPFVGSGLGVREWGIGLTLPFLDKGAARALGLTADLLNRAAEVLMAVPLGLVCLALLARRGGLGRLPLDADEAPRTAQFPKTRDPPRSGSDPPDTSTRIDG